MEFLKYTVIPQIIGGNMKLTDVKDTDQKNQKELTILIERDAFDAATEKAYKKNVSKINIPGFRVGKAPRSIIEKMYGKGFFYDEALNDLLPDAYEKAIEESKLEVVGNPEFDVKKIDENGAEISAKVYVKPELTLKAYTGLTAEKEEVVITDTAVDDEINKARQRNARSIDVTDRAAQNGDEVVFDFDGYVDGVAFDGGKAEKYSLKLGSGNFIPGFEDQVVGKNIGEDFDVNVTFPAEYQEPKLAGKPAVFKCKIHEIKMSEVPEADDEFAKDVSDFDTFAEYKADVKAKLQEKSDKVEQNKAEEALMEALVANIEGEIPEVMFENEAHSMLHDYEHQLSSQGITLQQLMQYTGQNEEQIEARFRPQAEARVKTRLALEAVVKAENIVPTAEEIEAEYKSMADMYKVDIARVKEAIPEKNVAQDVAVEAASKLVIAKAVITVKKPEEKKDDTAAEAAAKPIVKKSTSSVKKAAAKKEAEAKSEDGDNK